jgi:WASH complex subunit strumpellin
MANSFPNPDHRSTRLAGQASMLYVILYFSPDILHKQKATMREIVDKHFNDNFVISTYMGHVIDLTTEWSCYAAATDALNIVFTLPYVKQLDVTNKTNFENSTKELKSYLKEGVLQPDFLLDNMTNIFNCMRVCNISLRWRIMHRKCNKVEFQNILMNTVSAQAIVSQLLSSSQLEYTIRAMLVTLLDEKDKAWTEGKAQAADRMIELSEYFTGIYFYFFTLKYNIY